VVSGSNPLATTISSPVASVRSIQPDAIFAAFLLRRVGCANRIPENSKNPFWSVPTALRRNR
jgi:hypothetical protein